MKSSPVQSAGGGGRALAGCGWGGAATARDAAVRARGAGRWDLGLPAAACAPRTASRGARMEGEGSAGRAPGGPGGARLGLAGAAVGAAGVVLASAAGAAVLVVRRGRSRGPSEVPGRGGDGAGGSSSARGGLAAGGSRKVGLGSQWRALPVALRALQVTTAGMLGAGVVLGAVAVTLGIELKPEASLSPAGLSELLQEGRRVVRAEPKPPH